MKAKKYAGRALVKLHLNWHREWFEAIVAKIKRMEYRRRTPFWKNRLENRKHDLIQFRNGFAKNTPQMQAEFLGVRRIKKDGINVCAIRLGKILKIKRW